MTTPPDTSSTFFADAPFGNVVASASQRSQAAAGAILTFGPLDCSQFQGARFSFAVNAGGGVTLLNLQYFDDQALDVLVGDRWFIASAGAGSFLNVTLPHLADNLVVRMFTADANPLDVTWSIAQRQNAATQWNLTPQIVLGKPTTPTNVLSQGVNVALAAGTANIPGAGCAGVYSGPAHAWIATPLLTGVNVFIQQRDLNNVYQTNAMVRTDAQGNANLDFIVWPMGNGADIRIHTVNGGAASTLSWSITADEYRVGG